MDEHCRFVRLFLEVFSTRVRVTRNLFWKCMFTHSHTLCFAMFDARKLVECPDCGGVAPRGDILRIEWKHRLIDA